MPPDDDEDDNDDEGTRPGREESKDGATRSRTTACDDKASIEISLSYCSRGDIGCKDRTRKHDRIKLKRAP